MEARLRAATIDDAPTLHELVRAIEVADGAPIATNLDEVRERFEVGDDDPEHDLRVLDDGGTLIGWGAVEHHPSGVRLERAFLPGGVHPDHRGQGHGRHLLDWQTDRAAARLAATPQHLEALALTDRYTWQSDRAALFEAAGFAPGRYFDELQRPIDDLSDVGEPRDPDGIRIVPWTPEHHAATRLVNNAAFADHWGSTPRSEQTWMANVIEGYGTRTDLSFVALDGDEPVGHTLNAFYPDDEAVTGRRDGWVQSVATLRSHRRRGIAAALIVHSLHAFRRAGLNGSMLGVDSDNPSGAYGIYERLGYRPMQRIVVHLRTIRPGA